MDVETLGVFGGTFDPIHCGHLVAAEEARVRLNLREVIFAPATIPPHKVGEVITPIEHRLAMIRLAIASNPHFTLSLVDVNRPGPAYTVDSIHLLQEEWGPEVKIYFIMGLDSLEEILTWHRPELLIQSCHLAVVNRPGHNADLSTLENSLPGLSRRVTFVPMPQLDISSTDLQRRVREGRSIKYLVPEAVEAYIHSHGLYLS
ncbi:MAG: nicotinate-nucleotide adenylyltransferase [Anaerolineae bacterium]